MTSLLSNIAARHQVHWLADAWYRRSWYIGPQAASLLALALLFSPFSPGSAPTAPWPTAPATPPSPSQPTAPAANPDGAGASLASQRNKDACSGKNADEVLEACTHLIETLPTTDSWRAKALFLRARIHDQRHEGNEVVTDLNAAVEASPDNAEVRNYRGDYWFKRGWYDQAKDDYLAATRAKPTWATPLANLAETYRAKRELDLALAKIGEALRLAPEDPWVLTVKERIDSDRRPGASPMAAWKGTTEASQEDQDACSGKNADEALEACTHLIETLPKSDLWRAKALFYRGRAHDERHEGNEAVTDLNAAIDADPNDAEIRNYRGDFWFKVGWYDQAKDDYLAATRAKPTWTTPLTNLAETYRAKRELDLASAKVTEALRLAPQDPLALSVKARIDADRQNQK